MKKGKTSVEKNKHSLRLQSKAVHVTIHKLSNPSLDYWIDKARKFRSNVSAVLVGLEENQEEDKGLHAHIVIQFTTRQDLSRKQFVEHFGSDTLHIATKASKDAIVMALGYVSKAGTTKQWGEFVFRGIPLDPNPEVYRFQYQVKTKIDAVKYFHKVIKENLKDNKNVIKEMAKREDSIGAFLVANPALTNSLHKLALTWYLDVQNEAKTGFKFREWVKSPRVLRQHYRSYLSSFPSIFEEHLPKNSELRLESDYADHAEVDMKVLKLVVDQIEEALKFGPKRPHKSLNLYLWSKAPSFGKTRLLDFLDSHLMAYRLPDDQWYVDYENKMYQVLVSDEAAAFLKTKSYSHLKHILEGRRVEFNLKGREKVFKEDNPLIVLAENISFNKLMGEYFKHRYEREVMATRVLNLELKSRATLHFLLDKCVDLPVTEGHELPLFES